MKFANKENISLLTDLYELTMADAYLREGKNKTATFDLFVRTLPKNRGYLVACGIYDALEYIQSLKFGKDEIAYLKSTGKFSGKFLEYLATFRFSGEVYAIPEGTPFFPMEPVMRITAPLIEAQILETFLINCVGFQTLVATKAARVCKASGGKPVIDFGLRRTQGMDAGLKSAKAAYLGGCTGTSNVLAGKEYTIPITGTVAHSFILSYESELEAFRAIARSYGNGCVFLIDTYDMLQGAKNAVKIAKEMENEEKKAGLAGKESACKKAGAVRIDSGDLFSESKKVRKLLDSANLKYIKIIASGGLDEYKVEAIVKAGAPIDSFGVGTAMGVSDDAPSLDLNYKLCDYDSRPARKTSEGKISLPGKKQVWRFEENGKCSRDFIAGENEKVPGGKPLLSLIMKNGKLLFSPPPLAKIREKFQSELSRLNLEILAIENPEKYPVEISKKLL